jgi:Tol biopolymer transport system component/DNA-binding winged helix-turn-helix (wHTH) protein
VTIHLASEKDFEVGKWRVSPSAREIEGSSGRMRLEPRVMQVLVSLARRPGETVSREELLEDGWGGIAVSDDALVRSISQLRKALANGRNGVRIETVAKVGYRLVPAEQPHSRRRALAAAIAASVAIGAVLVAFSTRSSRPRHVPISRPLTSFPGVEQWPAISPSGDRVAYSRNRDLYVHTVGEAEGVRVAATSDREYLPAWSPGGDRIAFVRRSDASCEIFVLSAEGSDPSRLAGCGAGGVLSIDWSGQTLLVSERQSPLSPGRAFLIDLDSGARTPVLNPEDPRLSVEEVAFSPDGSEIAFALSPALGVEDLYIHSLESGRSDRVTRENLKIHGFDWLPDGSGFIVSSNRGGEFALWRVSRDGTDWDLVPGAVGGADEPRVSASGRTVYEVWGTTATIVRARSKGSLSTLAPSTRYDWDAELSPDGRKVTFVSDRSGSAEVWVAEASGERPIRRTSFGGAYTHTPRFSPDGRTIAFATPASGNFDLFLIGVESGEPQRITTDPSEDFAPSWTPDGNALHFGSTRSGEWQIWRLDLDSGVAVQVTREGGRVAQVSPDGESLYFMKSDRNGLFRLPLRSSGAEERVLEDLEPVDWNNWQVLERAVYYVRRPTPDEPELARLDLRTRRTETVRPLPGLLYKSGLSVAPDETEMLFTRVTGNEADLQVIDAVDWSE